MHLCIVSIVDCGHDNVVDAYFTPKHIVEILAKLPPLAHHGRRDVASVLEAAAPDSSHSQS